MDYQTVSKESFNHRETNDCTVKALAICCDIAYPEALSIMAVNGRRKGRGMFIGQWERGFKQAGFKLVRDPEVTAKTTLTVVSQLNPNRTYVVVSTRHVSAVVNGKMEDWATGRLKRVRAVYEVISNAN